MASLSRALHLLLLPTGWALCAGESLGRFTFHAGDLLNCRFGRSCNLRLLLSESYFDNW
jgi:hypothetical protein